MFWKMMKAKKLKNLTRNYKCNTCNSEFEAPMHCGHAMHPEVKDDGVHWVCWMGSRCGDEKIDSTCEGANIIAR